MATCPKCRKKIETLNTKHVCECGTPLIQKSSIFGKTRFWVVDKQAITERQKRVDQNNQ